MNWWMLAGGLMALICAAGHAVAGDPGARLYERRCDREPLQEESGITVRRCADRLGQDAAVPQRDSWICADNRHSSGLNRRTAVGRAPAHANRIGPGPYGLGT